MIKELVAAIRKKLTTNILKASIYSLLKKNSNWILPNIVKGTLILEVPTYYIDA